MTSSIRWLNPARAAAAASPDPSRRWIEDGSVLPRARSTHHQDGHQCSAGNEHPGPDRRVGAFVEARHELHEQSQRGKDQADRGDDAISHDCSCPVWDRESLVEEPVKGEQNHAKPEHERQQQSQIESRPLEDVEVSVVRCNELEATDANRAKPYCRPVAGESRAGSPPIPAPQSARRRHLRTTAGQPFPRP